MKKKNIVFLCILLLTGFVWSQKITIKVASIAPSRSPWDIEQKALAAEWAEITDGLVEVKFYNTTPMGGEGGVIKKMKSVFPGQKPPIDGAIFTNIGIYELAPKSNALTLCVPFMFRSQDELTYVLDELEPEIVSAVESNGYRLLGWFNVGWGNFFTKEIARTPDEIKDLKMGFSGISSPGLMTAFKTAGFNMIDLPTDKILQSIKSSNGISVIFSVPMYAYATQYYTGLSYIVKNPLTPIMTGIVISNEAWNSIPDKYKPELEASIERAEKKFISVQQETDAAYIEKIVNEGLELVTLTDSEVLTWEKELRADAIEMGQDKDSVINLEFFNKVTDLLDEYRAAND